MARQRLNDKNLRKINALTGNEYLSAWHRGGGDWRWVKCELPPTTTISCCEIWEQEHLCRELSLANTDYVNRVTGEVQPLIRDGRGV